MSHLLFYPLHLRVAQRSSVMKHPAAAVCCLTDDRFWKAIYGMQTQVTRLKSRHGPHALPAHTSSLLVALQENRKNITTYMSR